MGGYCPLASLDLPPRRENPGRQIAPAPRRISGVVTLTRRQLAIAFIATVLLSAAIGAVTCALLVEQGPQGPPGAPAPQRSHSVDALKGEVSRLRKSIEGLGDRDHGQPFPPPPTHRVPVELP